MKYNLRYAGREVLMEGRFTLASDSHGTWLYESKRRNLFDSEGLAKCHWLNAVPSLNDVFAMEYSLRASIRFTNLNAVL
jgi:hypothetical protein